MEKYLVITGTTGQGLVDVGNETLFGAFEDVISNRQTPYSVDVHVTKDERYYLIGFDGPFRNAMWLEMHKIYNRDRL